AHLRRARRGGHRRWVGERRGGHIRRARRGRRGQLPLEFLGSPQARRHVPRVLRQSGALVERIEDELLATLVRSVLPLGLFLSFLLAHGRPEGTAAMSA